MYRHIGGLYSIEFRASRAISVRDRVNVSVGPVCSRCADALMTHPFCRGDNLPNPSTCTVGVLMLKCVAQLNLSSTLALHQFEIFRQIKDCNIG